MPTEPELDDPGVDLNLDVTFRLGIVTGCASRAGQDALAQALHSLYHLWQFGRAAEASKALRVMLNSTTPAGEGDAHVAR